MDMFSKYTIVILIFCIILIALGVKYIDAGISVIVFILILILNEVVNINSTKNE